MHSVIGTDDLLFLQEKVQKQLFYMHQQKDYQNVVLLQILNICKWMQTLKKRGTDGNKFFAISTNPSIHHHHKKNSSTAQMAK